MGTINNGILGGFSGTTGPVIGGSWNGIQYMRSRPGPRTKPPTRAMQVQQAKFALATRFLRSMPALIKLTFTNTNGKIMSGYNSALSYTLQRAIWGEYPNLEIDYRKALVARGTLPNAGSVSVAVEGEQVRFNWLSNEAFSHAEATDQAIVVAYHAPSNKAYYTIGTAKRGDQSAILGLPTLKGEEGETWLAFISAAGDEVASSIYTGRVKIE